MRPSLFIASALAVSGLFAGEPAVVGWRMDTTGDYPAAKPPVAFGPGLNLAWTTPMPGVSTSSPIIVGDRIFCLADPNLVLGLDKATGAILWKAADSPDSSLAGKAKQDFEAFAASGGKIKSHKVNGVVTQTCGTPTSDGRRIFAFFHSGLAVCHDLDGKLLWGRFVAAITDKGYGQSASPALCGKVLVLQVNNSIYGLSADDGSILWQSEELMHQGSPVAMRAGAIDLVLTTNGKVRQVSDGEVVGAVGAPNLCLFATPVVSDGGKVAHYLADNRLLARVEVSQAPDGKVKVATGQNAIPKSLYYASLLITEDRIFMSDQIAYEKTRSAKDPKCLRVLDRKTLKPVAEIPIPNAGWLYPSPVRANGHIYVGTDKGTIIVYKPDREKSATAYEVVATNQIEPFRNSPVCEGNRLYLRCDKNFYCFQDKGEAPKKTEAPASAGLVP